MGSKIDVDAVEVAGAGAGEAKGRKKDRSAMV